MTLAKIKGVIRGLAFWVAASLLAILILEYNALLGLGVALILGVALGVFVFRDSLR